MKENNQGITLIALVITIIILVILVSVSITIILGNNGIIKQAQQGAESMKESEAKVELEIALLELESEKILNEKYNQNEYIDQYLIQKEMIVRKNIVIVDGWKFEIDRSVPKIINSLGKEDKIVDTEIYTLEDLIKFAQEVNNGKTFEDKTIKLMNDIDLQGNENNQWVPIGNDSNYFAGTFKGNNHTIKNVYIKDSNKEKLALFGNCNNAQIENLQVNGYISGGKNTAGIIAIAEGTNIINCINGVEVIGIGNNIAGIVANASNSYIEKCINNANVTGNASCNGGIAAVTESTDIVECCNLNVITGNAAIGGIVGQAHSKQANAKIEFCYNIGGVVSIKGNSNNRAYVGGIIGMATEGETAINYSYNIGDVQKKVAEAKCSGGIIGGVSKEYETKLTVRNVFTTDESYKPYLSSAEPVYSGINKDLTREQLINWNQGDIDKYLTNKFVKNSNINSGFPILAWQNK